jgi:hypothetical protein
MYTNSLVAKPEFSTYTVYNSHVTETGISTKTRVHICYAHYSEFQ